MQGSREEEEHTQRCRREDAGDVICGGGDGRAAVDCQP